jgi:hypothetical protein
MATVTTSIAVGELNQRMAARLRGSSTLASPSVVWQQATQRLLIHVDSLQSRGVDGWLITNLDVETAPTSRQRLQFIYFLGTEGGGDGLRAGATMNLTSTAAAQLADQWGADIQRVLWDAVLDGIEASLEHIREGNPRQPLKLAGFTCQSDELNVRVFVGSPP